jgi:hypothetical protein
MQQEENNNIAILITQQGQVQFTGAEIGVGAIVDASETLRQFVRGHVIRPQIPATEDFVGEEEAS